MTRIDFYILHPECRQSEEQLVCILAQKAVQQRNLTYVHAADRAQADRIDDLMWTFRDISFLPHEQSDGNPHPDTPVLIGHGEPSINIHDVMINLAHPTPGFFSRFERVCEIVDNQPEKRRQARERYRFYQERGYMLFTHEIKSLHER